MSGMLASVRSLDEAGIVFQAGVDIIDLKAPEQGALGAVDYSIVREVVEKYSDKNLVSATIGDLPMEASLLNHAINKMASTGVDFVKVGIFDQRLSEDIFSCFKSKVEQGVKLILVFFADQFSHLNSIRRIIRSDYAHGVMLDTAGKSSGSLLSYKNISELSQFIELAKSAGLITGLAGSLRLQDINILLPLGADYLGFRGALCEESDRTAYLDELAVYRIRSKIPSSELKLINKQVELT